MGNLLVFIIVILAGIYGFYLIYRQIKTGKCAGCSERNSCPNIRKGICPTEKILKKMENDKNEKTDNI